jgi:hypothetical protein
MNSSNPWADQNGSIQARRSATAGLPRATSMNRAIEDRYASGDAGDPDRETVGDLLGVIPLAVGEVALEVQVLHVQAERSHVEPGLVGPLGSLVRHGRADGQVAKLQVGPRQVVGGPQLHAEDLGLAGLLVRLGQQLDGLVVAAFAVADETQGHQRVGLHPRRVGGAGRGEPALGPFPGRGEVVLDQQGVGVGGDGAGVLPRRRVRGSGVDRGPGDLDRPRRWPCDRPSASGKRPGARRSCWPG